MTKMCGNNKILFVFVISVMINSYVIGDDELTWKTVLAEIRQKFPEVSQITTTDFQAWLDDKDREKPIILDVRSEKEFKLSHIRDARHAGSKRERNRLRRHMRPDKPIVVYCSVGYRSSKVAQAFLRGGFTNVFNLEGSIFKWANEGRDVIADNGMANKVHPYNAHWGMLLRETFHPRKNE